MLSSVEQAFVGRDEIRAPLETPAWEGGGGWWCRKKIVLALRASVWCNSNNKGGGGGGPLPDPTLHGILCGRSRFRFPDVTKNPSLDSFPFHVALSYFKHQ